MTPPTRWKSGSANTTRRPIPCSTSSAARNTSSRSTPGRTRSRSSRRSGTNSGYRPLALRPPRARMRRVSRGGSVNAQFGPHDLAGPARDALPAPPVAHRLDQDQAPAALVIRAGLLGDRSTRDDVPDLDQDPRVVGGQPHYHDR